MPDRYKAHPLVEWGSKGRLFDKGREAARNDLQLPVYELLQETKRLIRSTRLIVPVLYRLCVNVCILSDFMHM